MHELQNSPGPICGCMQSEGAHVSQCDRDALENIMVCKLEVLHSRVDTATPEEMKGDKSQPLWSVQWLAPFLHSCFMWRPWNSKICG